MASWIEATAKVMCMDSSSIIEGQVYLVSSPSTSIIEGQVYLVSSPSTSIIEGRMYLAAVKAAERQAATKINEAREPPAGSSSRVAPLSCSRFAVIKPVMGRQLLSAQGEGTRSLRKIDCQGRLCNTANIASNSDLVNSSTVRGIGESCWRGCSPAIIDNNPEQEASGSRHARKHYPSQSNRKTSSSLCA
ncbi:hypothetical protein GUITHDRAFT_110821 [Guillardia theta CCMP2712]|uniref:Uncharacterized protein n=1 Tax=Guillardia theta (strain CCMP2712) TaxID=905079 RepID=L1J3K4_GUITC|nr:hypothetical protein GUITHDRAFT_110821 [Guillardia theta CCMP2712]EKX43096.1 hypothetical protein GUITHDRAFT_110821 [Guillardia theta CCMP2712]|eukprot:XP_005830076.1 hypothetical protein GUITHDRAFT_110821 [Guillardia theta CCMP2712]